MASIPSGAVHSPNFPTGTAYVSVALWNMTMMIQRVNNMSRSQVNGKLMWTPLMRLPINHIKTSSINKDTITSNSVSDFIVGGIQLYQKCLRDENKYAHC